MTLKQLRHLITAFFFLAGCLTYCLKSQGTSPSAGIAVFIHAPIGETQDNLKATDFQLIQGGKRIAVTVHRPTAGAHTIPSAAIPTHVFVIIDQRFGETYSDRDALVHKLEALWSHGFLTSVQLAGLQATPFVSSPQEAQRTFSTLKPAPDPTSESAETIKTMDAFPGRKVVLYVLGESGMNAYKMSPQLLKVTDAAMAQVYVADGGRPSGSFDYFGPITHVKGSGLSEPPAETELGSIPKVSYPAQNMFSLGIFHEINLGTAIKKIVADSSNYFDLSLQCASPACFDPKLPLLIKINERGPLRVTAEGYGIAAGVALEAEAK